MIFVSEHDGGSTGFNTLTLLLPSILSTRFEQPYLASNYLHIDIRPTPDGGLKAGTSAEIRLKNQAIFQFVSMLEKTRERAIYMIRQILDEEDTLRTPTLLHLYFILTSRPAVYASPSRGAGTPTDAPPGYDA